MYPYPAANRVSEMFDALKKDFDSLVNDVNRYKTQREDYERKVQSQVSEMSAIKTALSDLERKHNTLAQSYKDDIMRLQGLHTGSNQERSSFHPADRRNEKTLLPLNMQSQSTFTFPSPGNDSPLGKRSRGDEPFSPPTNRTEQLPSIQSKLHKPNEESQRSLPQLQDTSAQAGGKALEQLRGSNGNTSNSPRPDHSMNDNTPSDGEDERPPSPREKLDISMTYELDHRSVVCCVRYSNDGKYLATGCNRKAQIFSVETGEKVSTFTDSSWGPGDLYLRSVCFSPDGRFLACGAEDQTVKLWDTEKEVTAHTFVGHTMDIYSLDYSSDGRFIVSGSGDKKAKVWDVENRKCMYTLGNDEVGPKDGVTSVAISPDGRLIAAGSLDKIVRLWDAHTGYFLERYEGHSDSVYSVAFSPDGKSLASGSLDKTLKIWDLSESRSRSRCRSTFTGHTDFVLSVAFSPDGKWLLSGSKDRSVKFWDPRTVSSHASLEGHKNSVISIAVNPSQPNFTTGSGDHKAKLWHFKNASEAR